MVAAGGIEIAVGRTREVLAESTFAVVASGTVTLEVAHFGVPMVVVYRAGRLGYWAIGRWLIRTPHLSLVNILAGRRIVPELMPWHGNTRQLTGAVVGMMEDSSALAEARRNLLAVVEPLRATSQAPAADRAAELVLEVLRERRSTDSP
jgi:lipid-A-disaccharide synthase